MTYVNCFNCSIGHRGILVGLYFVGRKLQVMDQQQSLIDQHKIMTSILVIDKKKKKSLKLTCLKWWWIKCQNRIRKMPLVKAKIGPQIMTLLCDEKIFKKLPTKKMVKVELAGIFIVGIKSVKK